MMATPKDLAAFAIGFAVRRHHCLPDDIYDIRQQPACNGIEVHVELSSRRFMQLKEKRRSRRPHRLRRLRVEQLQEVAQPIARCCPSRNASIWPCSTGRWRSCRRCKR